MRSDPSEAEPVALSTIDLTGLADSIAHELGANPLAHQAGKVVEVTGTLIRAAGLEVKMGELCELRDAQGGLIQQAEVVGLSQSTALLSPFGSIANVSRATRVVGLRRPLCVPVGDALLGRVIDALGTPIDEGGPLDCGTSRPIFNDPPSPMSRSLIDAPFYTGVRAVDALTTLGEGQRMGIFAPAGVGKSTLMGMFARGAQSDINVIALIGERGREVREFIELTLGDEGMARSVVVCATSDRCSIERAKAAYVATTIAEYFRDRGSRVLLMMDSVTRFARAQREIGLSAGEPPTRRGFPPSVFAELPRLLERAGPARTGSITAFYTILAEDESSGDPIAEEVRSILDGHLILSREVAARNQYPAIDVLGSLSRVMQLVTDEGHRRAAGHVRRLLAKYRDVETLLQVGEYQRGQEPIADEAIEKYEQICALLGQRVDELSQPSEVIEQLLWLAGDH
ncbi:type III secretion system ATPase SctN [Trinickia sp. LjRoot230]|uniref:type III secretion system ATPase SctN n=1 Tax=Trinickia sp. LjRoot230 TaxID=3342288 RepID=UPI003ECD2D6F